MLSWSNLPNFITVLRILLVAPTTWCLWEGRYFDALVLTVVAGVSDALDGALARRFHWTSRFGAAMDPVADKLLVAVLFIVFTIQGHIPLWLAVIVVVRDGTILAGAAVYRARFEPIDFRPTMLSKVNTAVQLIMLVLVLLGLADLGIASELAWLVVDPWLFVSLALLGIVSGVDYVVTWGYRAWRRSKGYQRRSARRHNSGGEAT